MEQECDELQTRLATLAAGPASAGGADDPLKDPAVGIRPLLEDHRRVLATLQGLEGSAKWREASVVRTR
jgi:hypothetical protein